MRRAAVAVALLLAACSRSGSTPPAENAAVSFDANDAAMNSAEIVPNDEGGNESDTGA